MTQKQHPNDWWSAHEVTIVKQKCKRWLGSNYRVLSLADPAYKSVEHILVTSILRQVDQPNITSLVTNILRQVYQPNITSLVTSILRQVDQPNITSLVTSILRQVDQPNITKDLATVLNRIRQQWTWMS